MVTPAPAPESVVIEEAPDIPPTRAELRRAALAALPQHRQTLVARVDRHRCLGSIGQVCTVCMERCPEPDVITLTGTEPVIDAERCTGCGECERRCPAPFPAVRVLPLLGGSR